jgi:hypothetical protein
LATWQRAGFFPNMQLFRLTIRHSSCSWHNVRVLK